jgi:hypothetical protein
MKSIRIVLAALLFSTAVMAVDLVPMTEQEGLERLARSKYKVDFAKLSNHYLNQTDRIICGPVVGSIVLNALRYGTDKAPRVEIPASFLSQMPKDKEGKQFDPRLRMYTPTNFLNEKALKLKTVSQIYNEPIKDKNNPSGEPKGDAGYQLAQFRQVFEEAHGVKAIAVNVGTKETATNKEGAKALPANEGAKIIADMKKNLGEKDNYIIANYSRSALKQPGGGHFSPVAAYDEKSHSFLILDVNPFGGPWVWVDENDLVNAMNTFDTVENRGALFVSEK